MEGGCRKSAVYFTEDRIGNEKEVSHF